MNLNGAIENWEGYFVQGLYQKERGWINLNISPFDRLEDAQELRQNEIGMGANFPTRIVYITTVIQVIEE